MKYISVFLAAALSLLWLTGCTAAPAESRQEQPLRIVTTGFAAYDWTREILGNEAENAELTLLGGGADLHSYQPTAADILRISTCDLFIYVGGESDAWVDGALAQAANERQITLNMLDALGDAALAEELVAGMQADGGDHTHEQDEDAHDVVYDEHIWLSLRNAQTLCGAIADALAALDTSHAAAYRANADAYGEALSALDARYTAAVEAAPRDTLLVCDRFPFLYLTRDYDLSYYAAFAGCSAETEASFATIAFLADKADALSLTHVVTLENADEKIARTVISGTQGKQQQIVTMNSMQSTTLKDAENGVTYLSIMEQNLAALQTALQ